MRKKTEILTCDRCKKETEVIGPGIIFTVAIRQPGYDDCDTSIINIEVCRDCMQSIKIYAVSY